MRRLGGKNGIYVTLLGGSFVVALVASWIPLGVQIDNNAYDWMFRLYRPQPWATESILLAIDQPTLNDFGGQRNLRRTLAQGLEIVSTAAPKAVAVDVILADDQEDPATDARLEGALRRIRKLVLPCQLLGNGEAWENPLPHFKRWAAGLGHIYAEPDLLDSVTRAIALEKATARERRWALSLETFRISRDATILESPSDLRVGDTIIPSRRADGRMMRIRYIPQNMPPVPSVSIKDLIDTPQLASRFSGKVVFVGMTEQSAVRDRLMTPYSSGKPMPGVEMHANAFETLAQGIFLTDAPNWLILATSALIVVGAGLAFAFLSGWQAYGAAISLLAAAHFAPYLFFTRRVVFPFAAPVAAAWLSIITAGAYQHLVARRRLRKAEAERARYQQAMHFVTHEMRTPLTAIQGSSELITRYNLSDDKRKQIAQLINSESKRLGQMIEMFLNVERLTAGQLPLKKEEIAFQALLYACVERARPLADKKQIRIAVQPVGPELVITGDLELMEYALYNLLTNAVKYSPPQTEITAFGRRDGERVRISVQDQGIGMDQKEVKKIFQKFYRTKRAEQSGEVGTGIGLSIVDEIITQHGGAIEVTSRPGQGSCFTLVLPVSLSAVSADPY
jgi:signal transduction histidine kinase